jgi:hypothetical protein
LTALDGFSTCSVGWLAAGSFFLEINDVGFIPSPAQDLELSLRQNSTSGLGKFYTN